jgi:ATP-dependent DNA helicase PIF1
MLSEEQQLAIEYALSGKNVFITGSAGVGKSFLVYYLARELKEKKKNVVITASTGMAAYVMDNMASTLHSFAKIGIGQDSLQYLKKTHGDSNWFQFYWAKVDILIIDEISMLDPLYFDKLEQLVRYTRSKTRRLHSICHLPFGGIQIICVGDFLQLPPVRNRDANALDPEFCFELPIWDRLFENNQNTIELTKPFRQQDKEFIGHLNLVRYGKIPKDTIDYFVKHANPDKTFKDRIEPTYLTSLNVNVNEFNDKKMKELKTPSVMFKGKAFYVQNVAKGRKPDEKRKENLLKEVQKNAPAEDLELKIGAQVLLAYNCDVPNGLVNGSRGIVTNFVWEGEAAERDHFPVVEFERKSIVVKHHIWKLKDTNGSGEAHYKQIPLRLAYALSIHRSQGTTIDRLKVRLDNTVFENHQSYTAISRAKNVEGLVLEKFDPTSIKVHPKALEFYQKIKKFRS